MSIIWFLLGRASASPHQEVSGDIPIWMLILIVVAFGLPFVLLLLHIRGEKR